MHGWNTVRWESVFEPHPYFRRHRRPGYTRPVEHEHLEFKIVMDDGPHTEVLGRLADLELAAATRRAAVVRYPRRNIQLRHGARIIRRHDGEPKPEPPPEPNVKSLERPSDRRRHSVPSRR
jgi:hypothetical protein